MDEVGIAEEREEGVNRENPHKFQQTTNKTQDKSKKEETLSGGDQMVVKLERE
jgi:hypothetical protein